ncbi:MAG: pyridoxine 5'-phosphate synthase [Candidatus Thermochlorobacter aerophilum]|jgi:pyridoxine 5-phosphate synthase|uniref:Pyridoxine 5'-phosphate synthase n=1 Tax=Candidatus Thermochlorobacter aerophilus TaxID=1868324 RepID=A0A395LY40_9BACT|nr:MAG: pyridoxine 5'-phosphate synthase [Candidatus Thermochlorobacter aerophilum]
MRLAVNVDHIATLRNARKETEPDPVYAAVLAELAGASGIVCHLREDRRHIHDTDLRRLRETLKTKLDLEMAATEEMKRIAIATKPDLVTLVPEKREELTTEGGLDVKKHFDLLEPFIAELASHSIPTSLFIEPEPAAVELAKKLGATFIELHTGRYSRLTDACEIEHELLRLRRAAELGRSLGLRVVAGHGLNYRNIIAFASLSDVIEEVSIGHAIVARAALVGMNTAVRDMLRLLECHSVRRSP